MPTPLEKAINGPGSRSGDVERESAQPRDVERATVETDRESDAIDFVPGENGSGERGPENDPPIPDTKDKNKRKHEKNRTKPYRTIARSRSK